MRKCVWSFALLAALFSASSLTVTAADKADVYTDEATAGPDFAVQGEYEGLIGKKQKIGVHVVALGDGKFDGVVYQGGLPGAGWTGKTRVKLSGESKDGVTKLTGQNITVSIKDGVVTGTAEENVELEAKKVSRQSPTLGAMPPAGATVLFDGKNVDAWQNGKLVDEKYLGVGTRTKAKFTDFTLHLEFRTPYMPKARGQGRGNSGMYLIDQYECQVLDSFGLTGENNECGGIYQIAKPIQNMCFPPLSWQTYDVDFTAAKFDADGKKTADAEFTIKHNGFVIHDKLRPPKATPGGAATTEKAPGSLMLQDHGDKVVFRNIWIMEKK